MVIPRVDDIFEQSDAISNLVLKFIFKHSKIKVLSGIYTSDYAAHIAALPQLWEINIGTFSIEIASLNNLKFYKIMI